MEDIENNFIYIKKRSLKLNKIVKNIKEKIMDYLNNEKESNKIISFLELHTYSNNINFNLLLDEILFINECIRENYENLEKNLIKNKNDNYKIIIKNEVFDIKLEDAKEIINKCKTNKLLTELSKNLKIVKELKDILVNSKKTTDINDGLYRLINMINSTLVYKAEDVNTKLSEEIMNYEKIYNILQKYK